MMSDNLGESLSEQVAAPEEKIVELKTLLNYKDEEICNLQNQVSRITQLYEKSYKYCEQLRSQCEYLEARANGKFESSHKNLVDAEVQVNSDDLHKDVENGADWKDGGNLNCSISELVKNAAQRVVNEQGYTYDDESKYYYHHSTGYYYSSESGLYYEPRTGIFFYFNNETGSYEFHSQIKPGERKIARNDETSNEEETAGSNLDKNKIATDEDRNESESSLEEGEIITDDEDGSLKNYNADDDDDDDDIMQYDDTPCGIDNEQEAAAAWPPCLRIMVITSVELDDMGSLYMVTHPGGTIGSKPDCDICIESEEPFLAEIKFDEDLQAYIIRNACQGSTFSINNQDLCFGVCEKSSWSQVKHLDVLKFRDVSDADLLVELKIHIHSSNDTCDDCEPGIVKAAIQSQIKASIFVMSKEEKEAERRRQLKSIKTRYGLKNDQYVVKKGAADITAKGYVDKAEERRKTVGSDNPYEKSEVPSSTDVELPPSNKGFKMLQKMGWEKGQSLGKTQSGRHDPVNIEVRRPGRGGLGTESEGFLVPLTKKEAIKATVQQKTRMRYQEIDSNETFDDSIKKVDDDDP